MRQYVRFTIGEFFTESPPFDLEGAFSDSASTTPLIFILSPGADPTDYLLQLAQSKGKGGGGLRIISLGQGQGPIAERAIETAQKVGDWVCLQNCHLAVSWLAKLEQIVEKTQNDSASVNQSFRLWLTSMPSQAFPVPVLQNGIKVTNEPPRGLKANLTRTFGDISADEYESCAKSSVFKKLAFATAFFNALILERRKFGAVGWNIPYEWMNSDLKAAMTTVKMYVVLATASAGSSYDFTVGNVTLYHAGKCRHMYTRLNEYERCSLFLLSLLKDACLSIVRIYFISITYFFSLSYSHSVCRICCILT